MSLSQMLERYKNNVQESRKPVPTGEYICVAESGKRFKSNSGKPGYKVQFKIIEGEHTGSRVWLDCYLTAAAGPRSAADLAKLGIVEDEHLDKPLQPGMKCRVYAIEKEYNGKPGNDVKRFDVVGRVEPRVDPFAPADLRAAVAPAAVMTSGEAAQPPRAAVVPVAPVLPPVQAAPVPVAPSHTEAAADDDLSEAIEEPIFKMMTMSSEERDRIILAYIGGKLIQKGAA